MPLTITLHDKTALKVLCAINYVRDHAPDASLDQAADIFKCALLLCDCEKRAPEVLRMER